MKRDSRQVLTEWLVLAAQGGNEAAFRELHSLWRADLFRLALVRVEQPQAAEEVLTDTWLAIARGLQQLADPACFPRWAFQIVDRRAADWVRQRSLARRREATATRHADDLAPMPAGGAEPPDDVIRLREVIGQLPTEQRELLHLYYDLERSVAEIAEVLAVPAGTIKSRLHAVRETLRQKLESQIP